MTEPDGVAAMRPASMQCAECGAVLSGVFLAQTAGGADGGLRYLARTLEWQVPAELCPAHPISTVEGTS